MSSEVLCPPQGVYSQSKTEKNLVGNTITAKFGSPLGVIGVEVPEKQFILPSLVGLMTIPGLQVLERTAKLPAIQTNTAEELFGPKMKEVLASVPSEISKRQEVMQTVVLLPTKPAETVVIEVVPESQKDKPEDGQRKNILNGFNSQAEIEALQKNSKISHEQAVKENLANMLRYHDEYTKSDPVIENPLMLDEDGDLANSDSGLKLLPLISAQERKGSVRDMMLAVQTEMREAEEGHVMVGVSGQGGTEMPMYKSDKELIYTESQIYVYIKGKGRQIRALTFISDMTLEECIRFYQSFAEPDPVVLSKEAAEIDRVSELERRPISITGGKIDFAGILKRIEDTMDGRNVMRAANGKDRTFKEAYKLVELGEKIHSLPEKCNQVAKRYENFLKANLDRIHEPCVAEAVKQRMDIALLEMTRIINFKGDVQPDNLVYLKAFSTLTPNVMDMNLVQFIYQKEIAYLLTRPGCNGSGTAEDILTGQSLGDILSGKSSISGGGESSVLAPKCFRCRKELCEGKCPGCERRNRRAA